MSVTGFSRYRDTSAVIPNLGGTTEQCFALSKFNASGFFYARNSGGYAMKLDKLVGDRFKERPSDCQIDSHAIMVRGGYIKYMANRNKKTFARVIPLRRCLCFFKRIVRRDICA